jgi:membrane-bound inhibitor of C-type lysozyme
MPKYSSTDAALLACALVASLMSSASAEEPAQTLSRATEAESVKTNRVIFACPKNALLTVEFVISDPAKPAIVRSPDGVEVSLPPRESGSGFRYADDTHELHGKGHEVTWTDGAKPPVICTEETPAAGGTEPK